MKNRNAYEALRYFLLKAYVYGIWERDDIDIDAMIEEYLRDYFPDWQSISV